MKSDVGGGDPAAVREMRRRIEVKSDEIARVVGLDGARDQAVERERFVGGAYHQGLIDVADEALRGRKRLDIVGIQAVEGAEKGERQPAAFGRVGIGVRQMREIRRQRRRAVHRERIGRRRLVGRAAPGTWPGRKNRQEFHAAILECAAKKWTPVFLPKSARRRDSNSIKSPHGLENRVGRAIGAVPDARTATICHGVSTMRKGARFLLDCPLEYGKRARVGAVAVDAPF